MRTKIKTLAELAAEREQLTDDQKQVELLHEALYRDDEYRRYKYGR